MLHLQAEEMRAEEPYKLSHLRLRRFSDYAKSAFEFSAGLLALALVAGIAFMVWYAAHSDGLVLESFAVPPELAAKGNSGEVLATRLLDKLSQGQNSTPSQTRPGRSLSGGFGDDIKVEIPETGVSLGELYGFLRRWLGHEAHVGGDVVRTPAGIAVSVRIDGRNSATYAGAEADLDALMLKAAEHVAEVTQPSRYGTYLSVSTPPRLAESNAVLERAAGDLTLSLDERATVLNNIALNHSQLMADARGANAILQQSVALNGDYPIARSNLASSEQNLGHAEAALAGIPEAIAVLARHAADYYPAVVISLPARLRSLQAQLLGDTLEMESQARIALAAASPNNRDLSRRTIALALARRHDSGATRAWLGQMPPPPSPLDQANRLVLQMQQAAALEQWPAVIAGEAGTVKAWSELPNYRFDVASIEAARLRALVALAKAKTGDIAGAESLIAATPGDCYDCVRIRGQIASEAKQWARADYWFAKAVQDAPSIPMKTGAARCWHVASRTRPSRSSPSPTRGVRTSPIRRKAGARR